MRQAWLASMVWWGLCTGGLWGILHFGSAATNPAWVLSAGFLALGSILHVLRTSYRWWRGARQEAHR